MRRRIGAEKIFFAAAGGRPDQRGAMGFALEHGQAVMMRTDPAGEHGVSIQQ